MTGWRWITKEAALRLLCHADKSARDDRENEFFYKAHFYSTTAVLLQHDFKHCGGAFVVFSKFGGRARLAVCGYPQIY